MQNAKMAIRDTYDAIVELVTNADDRYRYIGKKGRIDIEITRRRNEPSLLSVLDFADGMNSEDMYQKISKIGGLESGMKDGHEVRGTYSRGAKDIASLGDVKFESIWRDGCLHTCQISQFFKFEAYPSRPATQEDRSILGIEEGTGMRVTISIDPKRKVPQHKDFVKNITWLVPLRDIIRQQENKITVRDLQQNRTDEISLPAYDGKERLSETFPIPGYPDMNAKLVIYRAHKPFEKTSNKKFRHGGILVKSRHAIHEATLFDSELGRDPYAARFYGQLKCRFIDDLSNEQDERFSKDQKPLDKNPCPITDPMRRDGLTREHPFVAALYKEALKRLRPLVEEERRQRNERSKVESDETRKRLNALERMANQFMAKERMTKWTDKKRPGLPPRPQACTMNPPFAQMVVGESKQCWLSVRQDAFPGIDAGDSVQIECAAHELRVSDHRIPLESQKDQDGALLARWSIEALKKTSGTELKARVGTISKMSIIKIFGSEGEKYTGIHTLKFQKKKYQIPAKSNKKIKLFAPLDMVESLGKVFEVDLIGSGYRISGSTKFTIKPRLRIAMADITVSTKSDNPKPAKLRARLGDHSAETRIAAASPKGTGIEIKIEDISHGNQRYKWTNNVIEIAALHPSLSRYLGPKEKQFPGQEKSYFRVLLAEIVADAICSKILDERTQTDFEDYRGADWDRYYADFSELMNEFLPDAHELVFPDIEK